MDYVRIQFNDASTGDGYIMTLVKNADEKPELLNVVRIQAPFEAVYENSSLTDN